MKKQFRGKRKDNHRIIYGDLIHTYDYSGNLDHEYGVIFIKEIGGPMHEVIPESVEEYTGEQDDFGNDLYEGDTVYIYIGESFKEMFEMSGTYVITKFPMGFDFVDSSGVSLGYPCTGADIKIEKQ